MPAGAIAAERIRALAGEGVPGVVVLVAGPEGVRSAGAAGLADIAARVPASPGMVCPWFSMTKIVTAMAAMRLAERGVFDLDAPSPGTFPRCDRCGRRGGGPARSPPATCSPTAPAWPTPSRSAGCIRRTSRLPTRMRSCAPQRRCKIRHPAHCPRLLSRGDDGAGRSRAGPDVLAVVRPSGDDIGSLNRRDVAVVRPRQSCNPSRLRWFLGRRVMIERL